MQIASATSSSDMRPAVETGGNVVTPEPVVTPDPNIKHLVVAVHGVGDQYSYATLQSVVNQFCRHYQEPMDTPLGAFHNGRHFYSIQKEGNALTCFGFAEVYWAKIPRKLVDDKHTLEEAKNWATTIIERLRMRWKTAKEPIECSYEKFALSRQILHEMIETIAVLERLCFIAEKAGLFTFDLRRILEDYLGDVQVVAEFAVERDEILNTFQETMEQASRECPNADIYIVAHSEGTVIALLGLLDAFESKNKPAPEWTGRVRGFMTLGSPIDKHLYFWPNLFENRRPTCKPSKPIAWRNYYDFGDPIGFDLDGIRDWLDKPAPRPAGVKWRDVFEFEDEHDFGFTRYPFPGKAHVDYWEDDQVFGHFIKSVVEPDDKRGTQKPGAHKEAVGDKPSSTAPSSPLPPQTKYWSWIASWILPYVGVFAVLLTAAFIMDKAVLMASGADKTATVLEIFRGTVGLATLLYGVTIGARIPRLTKSPFSWVMAFLACVASVAACLALWGAFDSVADDIVPVSSTRLWIYTASVIVISSLFSILRPRWGATPMIVIGTGLVAFSAFEIVGAQHEGPTWPLVVATAAFLYLWWLAALLFDLIVAWHVYIRWSQINEIIRQMTTPKEEFKPRQHRRARVAHAQTQTT